MRFSRRESVLFNSTVRRYFFSEVFEHKGTYIIGSGDSALGADAWSLPITFDTHDRHLRTVRLGTDACVPFQSRHVFIAGPDEQDHPCAYITSAETETIPIRFYCFCCFLQRLRLSGPTLESRAAFPTTECSSLQRTVRQLLSRFVIQKESLTIHNYM